MEYVIIAAILTGNGNSTQRFMNWILFKH